MVVKSEYQLYQATTVHQLVTVGKAALDEYLRKAPFATLSNTIRRSTHSPFAKSALKSVEER